VGGHRYCQDRAHTIFKHKKTSGQNLSEKFSSRFYATSHRTEVARFELGNDFFVQFVVYFHIVANQVFDRPFFSRKTLRAQKLSPRRYDKLHMFNRTRLCLLCVMQILVVVTTEKSRSNVIKRCRVWQNSKSIQKCHRTLVRGHAILPSYEVVATLT